MPVGEMMQSWTTQMGYPVLKVTGSEFGGGAAKIKLEQSWFLADGSEVKAEEAKVTYRNTLVTECRLYLIHRFASASAVVCAHPHLHVFRCLG